VVSGAAGASEMPLLDPQPEQEATVRTPALVIFQVEPEPRMSTPLPALEIAMAAPEAEALDWVTPRTIPESVPEVELMAEVSWKAVALSALAPVIIVRLKRTSAALSAALREPLRLICRSLIPEAAPTLSRVIIAAPVPLGFKVKAPLEPVAIVKAPESAMLLVVKV